MKDISIKKLVLWRLAFVAFVVMLLTVAVHAQTGNYTRPLQIINCLVPPGQSPIQTLPGTSVVGNATITSIELTGTRSATTAPSTCANVSWVVRHVNSGNQVIIPFNANGATSNAFNGLPANSQWQISIVCGPPPANCLVATINNGRLRVNY